MKVVRSTELGVSAAKAWSETGKPRLLEYVARPMLMFRYIEPPAAPPRWEPGEYKAGLRVFGVVPFGTQVLGIEFPPTGDHVYQVRDNGRSELVRTWNHLVTIEAIDEGRCRYTDEVIVHAGLLTPVVWAFAWFLYRHRQRRWKRLVANGFDYDD